MTRDDLQWITENQSWNPAERLSQSHSHHFALPFSVLNNLTCGKSHSCRKILGKATYNLNPQTVFSRSEQGSVLPFWADFSDCGRELCLCLGEKKIRKRLPEGRILLTCSACFPFLHAETGWWLGHVPGLSAFHWGWTATVRPQPGDTLVTASLSVWGCLKGRQSHEKWMCKNRNQ